MTHRLWQQGIGTAALRSWVAGMALLAACGGELEPRRAAQPQPAGTATAPAPSIAAPARPASAATATASAASTTGAHAKHLAVGIDCVNCHPCGGRYAFDVPFTYPQGTTSAGGTLTLATATTPTTCSVGCHAPLGSPSTSVVWNTPGPLACTACHAASSLVPQHPAVSDSMTRADCQGCHDTGSHAAGSVVLVGHPAAWMTQSDPGFHAFAAERGLASCRSCHQSNLAGAANAPACAQCHKAGGTANDLASCTACHGGGDNGTGAPPRAIWGYEGDAVRAGAHTAHLAGSDIALPFDCAVCHAKPADLFAAGHIDTVTGTAVPLATVSFAGIASGGANPPPAWDRASATCSNTYCHGGTLGGGTHTTPVWTRVGAGEATCGSCHGLPPPTPHPIVDAAAGLSACNVCHSLTIDAAGAIIPPGAGGKHLDGVVEAAGHAASWTDTASPGFHAYSANIGISACTSCHGADLSGGTAGVACAQCHRAGGPANDLASCTACHGGVDNQSGAPPRATWGNSGDPLRVGAHTAHVTGGALAVGFDCSACHVKPQDALSPGHVSQGIAVITWGGLATTGGANPSWNRVSGTCSSTYCHGSYSGTFSYETYDWGSDSYVVKTVPYVGGNGIPTWTDGPMTCGSCHGNPPAGTGVWHSGHHGYYLQDSYNECQTCHPDATSVNGVGQAITNPSQHIDGIVEVTPQWTTSCYPCH